MRNYVIDRAATPEKIGAVRRHLCIRLQRTKAPLRLRSHESTHAGRWLHGPSAHMTRPHMHAHVQTGSTTAAVKGVAENGRAAHLKKMRFPNGGSDWVGGNWEMANASEAAKAASHAHSTLASQRRSLAHGRLCSTLTAVLGAPSHARRDLGRESLYREGYMFLQVCVQYI